MLITAKEISEEEKEIWQMLDGIADPEIPVLSVNDLGIVRNVKINMADKSVQIEITPTYSGCPAMDTISMSIRIMLIEKGYTNITISKVLAPAWTTDWMSAEGKQKLTSYGIAPPGNRNAAGRGLFEIPAGVQCPQCNSFNTYLISEFGSTACKSLYQCKDCKEPFDAFKCH